MACKFIVAFAGAALLAAAGCSKADKGGSDVSTVDGALALSSYPNSPTGVAATDEAGTSTTAIPAKDGRFTLVLKKGHQYSIEVQTATASESIAFPRKDGSVKKTFRVTSGNAKFDLGTVRHLDAAPSAGFSVVGTAAGDAGAAECEDGFVLSTGAACVDDQTVESCNAGSENESGNETEGDKAETECASGVDQTTGLACGDAVETADVADGECVDGIDEATGAACIADEVDTTGAISVADHNVPEDIGGCNDGAEQEGEYEGEY